MRVAKSIFSAHAHAWFAACFYLVMLGQFLLMKIAQVYCELQTSDPCTSFGIHAKQSLHDGFSRRIDDPSLWALLTGVISALLLSRAIFHASQSITFPRFLWTRDIGAWIRVAGWAAALVSVYLGAVYIKQETFWFGRATVFHPAKVEHARHLGTHIEHIQILEGGMCVGAVLVASSLVGPVYGLGRLLRGAHGAPMSIDVKRCAARLATLGVSPLIVLGLALAVFSALKQGFGVGPIDKWSDILGGAFVALLLCLPTLVSTREFWWRPERWDISLGTLTAVGLLLYGAECVRKFDVAPMPLGLLERSAMSPRWRLPYAFADGLTPAVTIWSGVSLVVWYYA